jgi:hypothetical protein
MTVAESKNQPMHAKLKYLILLLIVLLLSACVSAHQSSQPATENDTSETSREAQTDQGKIASLQNDLAALNAGTDITEAGQVAQTAIQYSAYLADRYELVRPAVLHNVLVRIGLKDRGLCHHWTTDLMEQLELLELKTYQLYWGVAHRGSELREHNSVVVAAKGQRFVEGIVLDPWRNSGELHWAPVQNDRYPWKERPRSEW